MSTSEAATLTANGSAPDISKMSPEQLKALRSQIAKHDRAKVKRKPKPAIQPRGKVTVVQREIAIEDSSTDFDRITDEPFSLVPGNVAQIWVKTGKERMKCVNTGKSIAVGSAAVYRVFL
jgi:hypothetical protein